MASAYQKFENQPSSVPPTPSELSPQQHHLIEETNMEAKNYGHSKKLAIVGMVFSCVALLFGIMGIGFGSVTAQYCCAASSYIFAEIWVPIIGIICAGLGLGALKRGGYNGRCLLTSHFVMCIINAIAFLVLTVHAGIVFGTVADSLQRYSYETSYRSSIWVFCAGLQCAIEILLTFIAGANLITNIVSAAFICRYWCGKGSAGQANTIVYVPSQIQGGNGPMQMIVLPPGSQISFLPSSTTNPVAQNIDYDPVAKF